MAKHKYERRKPAVKAHLRALEVVWHTQYRPSIKRRLRALQRQTTANLQNFIKKLR